MGAGPCGLGCARELERLGHAQWKLFERHSGPGGHASSVVDAQGFTWDLGGHVVFSHFGEFDALLREVMGEDVYHHDRSSYVHFSGRWVPYPFQNNLRYLPPHIKYECILGLVEAPGGAPEMDFASWMEAAFGPGITRNFMRPYNFKVWATPAEEMASTWIAERVSVVDYRRALRSVLLEEDDPAWGPNSTFEFPKAGGTGEIYRRLAARLRDRIFYEREMVEVDALDKVLRFADGTQERYDVLVSTVPLDVLVARIRDCPDVVRARAGQLKHNGVYMVGVGYQSPLGDDKSWMYFPDEEVPFYRATNFAKYARANVPGGDTGKFCSYLTETAYSEYKPVERAGLEERVVASLARTGVIAREAPVASVHLIDIEYAYPVPTLDRDRALAVIQPWLAEHSIYSRGRFGSWRYEIGNMDHAVKMGTDVARLIVRGTPEELWAR